MSLVAWINRLIDWLIDWLINWLIGVAYCPIARFCVTLHPAHVSSFCNLHEKPQLFKAQSCILSLLFSYLFRDFAIAAVTVDSSQMTASWSASWSRFSPPSNSVNGHVSTIYGLFGFSNAIFQLQQMHVSRRWKGQESQQHNCGSVKSTLSLSTSSTYSAIVHSCIIYTCNFSVSDSIFNYGMSVSDCRWKWYWFYTHWFATWCWLYHSGVGIRQPGRHTRRSSQQGQTKSQWEESSESAVQARSAATVFHFSSVHKYVYGGGRPKSKMCNTPRGV